MEERLPASAWPTLRQLQFLAALQAQGSFVRAAEQVGVTQPTLSAGVKELESALGVLLVERGRAGAVLTPAGEEAAARAGKALEEVEDLIRAVRRAGAPLTGPFRLGAIPTIAPFMLPRALRALRGRYPELRLILREDVSARLVEALRARTIDAALIALPYEAVGIATEALFEDEFLVAYPHEHRFASRDKISPRDLAGEDVLLLEDGHCLREHALTICGSSPQTEMAAEVAATSLHTLVQMVAGGMGVTLLPRLAIEGGVAGGAAVATRSFSEPVVGRSIGVAWRAGGLREKEARMIAKALRETVVSSDRDD